MARNSYRKAEAPLSPCCLFLALPRKWEAAGWMVKEDVEQFAGFREVAVHFKMYLLYFVANNCFVCVKLLFSFTFFPKCSALTLRVFQTHCCALLQEVSSKCHPLLQLKGNPVLLVMP